MELPFMSLFLLFCFLSDGLSSEEKPASCSCDRDISSVKMAFCSSRYSFKGTVLDRAAGKVPSNDGRARFSEIFKYKVRLDAIFKGVKKALVGKIVTISSEKSVCAVKSLQKGKTYAFQVERFRSVSICDRIDLFSAVTRLEKKGLLKKFRNVCLPVSDQRWRVSKEIETDERANYHGRMEYDQGPTVPLDRSCYCPLPDGRAIKTKATAGDQLDEDAAQLNVS